MAGGTGTSSRGRGGKFKKYTRGGGKHFSRDIRPTDAEGNEVSMWSVNKKQKDSDDDDDDDDDDDSDEDSEEETSEEEDSDDAGPSTAPVAVDSRDDRKAQKKARKEAAIAKQKAKTVEVGDLPSSDEDSDSDSEDDDMPANPNHSKAARKQTTASDDVDDITEGVKNIAAPTRRERETMEAAAAKERYMRQHLAGKTDEAKADMARLKLIREQREAEAARRAAEKEEKEEQEKIKRQEFEAREARKKAMKKNKKK